MTSQKTEPAPASGPLSPETLVDGPWFERVKGVYVARKGSPPPRWIFPLVGLLIAGLLFWFGWRTIAYISAALVFVMLVLERVSPQAAAAVHRGLAAFGRGLGRFIGWILLVPAYLIVGPAARLLTRVLGSDPLALRAGDNSTFWTWADSSKRREKQASRMFCAERIPGGRNWLAALAVLAVIGFVLGELVLRFWFGFHNPVLYQNDSHCGFRVRPSQDIATGRGRVQINNFGMRYHSDITPEKPPGTFRILMIGDSTLYGGEYLTNEETYASLVEERLNKRFGGGDKKFQVLPIAANAWGPLHQLGWVEKFGTVGSDLTVITTPIGDVDRPKYLLDSTRFMAAKPKLAWQTVGTWACWVWRKKLGTTNNDLYQSVAEADLQVSEGVKAFVNLAKLVRKTCPEVFCETLPQEGGYGQLALEGRLEEGSRFQALWDMLQPQLKAAGFDVTYPIHLFKGMGKEIFHDQAHLDVKGHEIYADYLISRIVEASPGFRKYAGVPLSASPAPPVAAP